MLRKPTKSSCFLEDIRVPFDCKQQINTKHQKQKTSHVTVFKKTSVQSYFRWNPCQTLCKFTESLHLQFLFTLQRLAFMTRHQFFPACLPFVNTVYSYWSLIVPAGIEIPRRHPSNSRVYYGQYLQFKYTVSILGKNLDLLEQGPRGIGR